MVKFCIREKEIKYSTYLRDTHSHIYPDPPTHLRSAHSTHSLFPIHVIRWKDSQHTTNHGKSLNFVFERIPTIRHYLDPSQLFQMLKTNKQNRSKKPTKQNTWSLFLYFKQQKTTTTLDIRTFWYTNEENAAIEGWFLGIVEFCGLNLKSTKNIFPVIQTRHTHIHKHILFLVTPSWTFIFSYIYNKNLNARFRQMFISIFSYYAFFTLSYEYPLISSFLYFLVVSTKDSTKEKWESFNSEDFFIKEACRTSMFKKIQGS